jgi:taurine dioxygenase
MTDAAMAPDESDRRGKTLAGVEPRPLSGALGVELQGVDISGVTDDGVFQAVHDAFYGNNVMLLRDQTLDPAAQVAFTERFGAVEEHPLRSRRGVEGHPAVLVLENRPGQPGARNDFWHSDISFADEPPGASVLHALIVPEGHGDTMFCNMYAAYEDLSPGLRRMLDGLQAIHTADALIRRNNEQGTDGKPIAEPPEPVAHPVVRTHPVSGRKALYVNPYFTSHFAGMTVAESRPLIEYLAAHASRPENVYRHRWRAGDVLMWDNRCTMHYAVRDYDDTMPRLMHRTTAAGERPV